MKICFFTENYYKGGLDTFIINLINTWPNVSDRLTLVCNGSHPGLETIAKNAVHPIEIKTYSRVFTSKIAHGQGSTRITKSFPVRAFFALAYRFLQYPILFPWYLLTLSLFFRRSVFDRLMVVNGGYPASLLCRCATIAWRLSGKRPLATFNFHNSTIKPPWYIGIPEYLIDLTVIWSAAQIVSVSKNCLSTLSCRRAFQGCTKLRYIYNGIEDPRLMLKDGNDGLGSESANDQYCLMLATYEPRKGHAYLLQAFESVVKDCPDARLQIYGYGNFREKQRVADEVKRLALENNVSLNGFTPKTASLIANARLLVVPSQAYESFGLTIIEAMAFGIPVVTTNVGGMPEVLADSNAGYVCSKDDPIAFADAIKRILGDPVLASELGRNGRQIFEQRFTASNMSRQYELIIKGRE